MQRAPLLLTRWLRLESMTSSRVTERCVRRAPTKSRLSCWLRYCRPRSEERRVGKSVDLGGRRIIKKKKQKYRKTSAGRSAVEFKRGRALYSEAAHFCSPFFPAPRRGRRVAFFFFKQKTAYEMIW